MSIHRPTWDRSFFRNQVPTFPCPQCVTGKLKLNGDLITKTPIYIKDYQKKWGWDPDSIIDRWFASLQCDENNCGEIVYLIGDTETVAKETEVFEGRIDWAYESVFRIRSAFPALPIFRPSTNVPSKVKEQLELAFGLYWADTSACAARLRTAVEAMLDHEKVPTQRMNKKNKLQRLTLHERIESFVNGLNHRDELHGLRNIGNLGAHSGSDVAHIDLLDALDVIRHVLYGLYDTKEIKAKAKSLSNKK